MTTKHTPGPWEALTGPDERPTLTVVSVRPTGQLPEVCDCNGAEVPRKEREANARLIAAAPDLAAALAWALRFANTASMHDPEWTDADVDSYYAARSALEKAGVLE